VLRQEEMNNTAEGQHSSEKFSVHFGQKYICFKTRNIVIIGNLIICYNFKRTSLFSVRNLTLVLHKYILK